VRYGSIRVMLNGESTNRGMTISGVEDSYDCLTESGRRASLPLHTGENLVEIFLADTWNHAHKATFSIVIPAKPTSKPKHYPSNKHARDPNRRYFARILSTSVQARCSVLSFLP
jgi:hypothetical protein